MTHDINLQQSHLGKKTSYVDQYDPSLLFPLARKSNRDKIGIKPGPLPFFGFDLWNHYEVSWLNEKGKPIAAIAEIMIHCDSENIIESKSMKLYFNSLNNTIFPSVSVVEETVQKDLKERLNTSFISVRIIPLSQVKQDILYRGFRGICLDELDIACSTYHHQAEILTCEQELVEEEVYSDLLKSNCLVTNQPDWCSVSIAYQGKKIKHENLLRYIVSFRNDNEFHEQCIERIFIDIMRQCQPQQLTVYGRSNRRGGLDINSYRSTHPVQPQEVANRRLCRQ